MEAYLGTWKVESNGDFYRFMNHFGVPTPVAKLVLQFGSKTQFSQVDPETYCITVSTVTKKTIANFKLGEEFQKQCPGGGLMKTIITIDNGVMKEEQIGEGQKITVTRTIEGDTMTVVYNVGDLTCTRIYKRVKE